MNKIKFLTVALTAAFAFVSCSDEQRATMLWEVSAAPAQNVKAAFDPRFYQQIQITSDGQGGEVTLTCTNYKTLNLNGIQNGNDEYADTDCQFTAKITDAGIVKITLDKMPEGFQETKTSFYISGIEGKDSNITNVSVIRKA